MQYILRIHNTQLFFFYVNFALPTGACVHGQEIEYLSVCFLDLNSLPAQWKNKQELKQSCYLCGVLEGRIISSAVIIVQ